MGEQRKKIQSWRYGMLSLLVVFACFFMSVGVGLVGSSRAVSQNLKLKTAANPGDVCYWGIDDSQWGVYMAGFDGTSDPTTFAIGTQGQLAYLSYELNRTGVSDDVTGYSGYSFILNNDIDLEKVQNVSKTAAAGSVAYDYPLWLPMNAGKNKNITFDGKGYSIKGMHIVYDDKCPSLSVGFFGNITGGIIKNVNFVNPIIEYHYSATSYAETDASRPALPTDVCIGVIAGCADSTYIQNVNIINPTIIFETDDVNAHNFYVGTAVGKLSFTTKFENVLDENNNEILDEENKPVKKISSINTTSPSQWGLDTVNVYEDTSVAHGNTVGTTMTVNLGGDVNTTFGHATYGYFGGLVGANVSSKVINSTIRNYSVTPILATMVRGTYYIGGLAGLTTQIATDKDLIVAAGLYNNLLLDVNLGTVTNSASTLYTGKLVGRVYSGGWVYNNLIAGGTMTSYDNFWGQVYNSNIYLVADDDCIGHVLGALDSYYFNGTSYIGGTGCTLGTQTTTNGETYYYCGEHQTGLVQLDRNKNGDAVNYGSATEMTKYNYYFENWSGNGATEYIEFITNEIYTPEEQGATPFTKMGLMSSVVCDDLKNTYGSFYKMSLPILNYELGLSVSKTDELTGNELTVDERILASVYQFRRWGYDTSNSNAPVLGEYYGTPCELNFITNHQSDLISEAYFAEKIFDGVEYTNRVHEKTIQRTYQQIMIKPSVDPVCEGYTFVGWKIKLGYIDALIADENNSINSYADVQTSDYSEEDRKHLSLKEDATYDFDNPERISLDVYTFVAVWKINTYKVYYMIGIDDEGNGIPFDKPEFESVVFGRTIDGVKEYDKPTSDQGYVFAGWYLKENLPATGEELKLSQEWKFGQNGYTMPGRDIELYAGWIDNFNMLSQLLDDPTYKNYYENYEVYFSDETGYAYRNVYKAAFDARAAGDTTDTVNLLNELLSTYYTLRVDPKKILNTSAFDNDLIQNSCPFLYDSNYYLSYRTFKETLEKYSNQGDYDTLVNIAGYVTYYNKINELFNALGSNLKSSVVSVGGVDSVTIVALIEKYQNLEERYAELYANGDNVNYDTSALDSAEQLAKKRWTEINMDLVLKDVEAVVADYEKAFNELHTKSVVDSNSGNSAIDAGTDAKNDKSNFSPIMISIAIVAVLAAGVFGYIGVDIVFNKRRAKELKAQKINKTKQVQTPDEDTYI